MVGGSFNWSYIYLEFRMSTSYYFSLLVFLGIVLFELHYSLDGHS